MGWQPIEMVSKERSPTEDNVDWLEGELERFKASMNWSDAATSSEKILVYGNLSGFVSWLKKSLIIEHNIITELRESATILGARQGDWVEHILAIPPDGDGLTAAERMTKAANILERLFPNKDEKER